MTARVYFNFVHRTKTMRTGRVAIDVEDIKDQAEISRKLEAKEFSEYLPLMVEDIGDTSDWSFRIRTEN